MSIIIGLLLRTLFCKLISFLLFLCFPDQKCLGHCYQIGLLLLTVWLPKSHTVSCAVFCPMTTRVINQWVISQLFFVINILIVELSKQLLLSCNIHLCGLFAFLFLGREWKRSLFADQMCSQLRFIKNHFTFPFVLHRGLHITKPSFISCPTKPLRWSSSQFLETLTYRWRLEWAS